ncbi:MARVEL domain-containing protein 3-like isoform X2 [Amblyraja radiata]|uniref:MARVEL domain-containing protein 3-like isoform X2 n=1 Tax=Amblyraja radiata TaxID=386614 RepID=UPI00140271DB|nr:MARVEL domain-containing protein 3-like isoform X2 [Amblyraja radiata]
MAHSANKADVNLREQDNKHCHHEHYSKHSNPRKSHGDGSRNTRGRDYSQQNSDPHRDVRRGMPEGKRSQVRDVHNRGDRTREDKQRMEREYHKRKNRSHPSKCDQQPNYKTEKEIPLPHDGRDFYGYKYYAETLPSEYVITEGKISMHEFKHEDSGEISNRSSCLYLCTNRGIVQMLEAVLNLLVLVCVVASYVVLSGYSSNGGLATSFFSINSNYSPLEGEQLKDVQKLDREFILMRAPGLYSGIGVTIAMFAITLAIMIKGAQNLHTMPLKWLIFEVIFNILASLGYAAAVGVYLYFVLQVNGTDICKRRERVYARYGLNWMNCDLSGSDAAAACFAIILVICHCVSAILAAKLCRTVRELNKNTPHS